MALLLPLNMYSDSVFLFLCLSGAVPPAGALTQTVGDLSRQKPVCTFVYCRSNQAEVKSEYRYCGLTQLSYPTVSIFKSYYENMYDTKT